MVAVEISSGVATVTLDHASRRNALTWAMLDRLSDLLSELAYDHEVSVLVLAGANGDFSSGMDIAELSSGAERGLGPADFAVVEDALAGFPKPTIAAITGYCVGGGAQLAVACDLRIAGESARLAITPTRLGVVYPASSVERLVRTLGPTVAKRLRAVRPRRQPRARDARPRPHPIRACPARVVGGVRRTAD